MSTQQIDVSYKNINIIVYTDEVVTGKVLFYVAHSNNAVIVICFEQDDTQEKQLYLLTEDHPNFYFVRTQLAICNSIIQLKPTGFSYFQLPQPHH